MTKFIEADSLAFLSIDGLYRAMGETGRNEACPQHCDACFTSDYPTPLTDYNERDRVKQHEFALPLQPVA